VTIKATRSALPVVTLVLGVLAAPLAADAQQAAARALRIGVLWNGSPSTSETFSKVLRQAFRDLGYVDGENIAIEDRWAEGRNERIPDLAAELIRRNVTVMVTHGDRATRAVQQKTTMIPRRKVSATQSSNERRSRFSGSEV
jgi:putative ABC transport system substrate-binding protein